MKPIISPLLIYLIDLVYKFQVIINIALVVLGFTIIGLGIAWLLFSMEYDQDDSIIVTCKKIFEEINYLVCRQWITFCGSSIKRHNVCNAYFR